MRWRETTAGGADLPILGVGVADGGGVADHRMGELPSAYREAPEEVKGFEKRARLDTLI
jgi:hypothetical protein